jgi:hypothetical protein
LGINFPNRNLKSNPINLKNHFSSNHLNHLNQFPSHTIQPFNHLVIQPKNVSFEYTILNKKTYAKIFDTYMKRIGMENETVESLDELLFDEDRKNKIASSEMRFYGKNWRNY